MADSDALRSRRRRAHAQGDHSLCRRCADRPPRVAMLAVPGEGGGAVASKAAAGDAAGALTALAVQLAAAYAADPANAMLARELRITLQALAVDAEKPDADLTGLFGALQA